MQREYKGVLFTDHALQRMKRRRISHEMVVTAIKQPERREREADGDTKFIKTIKQRNLHVISTYLKDERKWLVKSTWVRGEEDSKPWYMRLLKRLLRAR